jgi:hypothetical protein
MGRLTLVAVLGTILAVAQDVVEDGRVLSQVREAVVPVDPFGEETENRLSLADV